LVGYGLNVQAVVDGNQLFRHVSIKFGAVTHAKLARIEPTSNQNLNIFLIELSHQTKNGQFAY